MKTYRIWYRKEPTYLFDPELKAADIAEKYRPVIEMQAGCLDEVFENQQEDVWSLRYEREMRDHIRHLGLKHISMSVGDVAEVGGNYFQVDLSRWSRVN